MLDLSENAVTAQAAPKLELAIEGVVEAQHLDRMGHMNVAWYLHWFDRGIWEFFERHGLGEVSLERTRRGCFALEDHIHYRSELREGDALAVHTGVIEVRPKNLRLVQHMVAPALGKVAATREVVAVHIDLETRRSTPFSDEVRTEMESCLKGAPPPGLNEATAQSFAKAWIAAWNALDVETVLAHYAEDAVFVSPRAQRLMGSVRRDGKAALRAYWLAARERVASVHFTLDQAIWSPQAATLTVLYTAAIGSEAPVRAVEIMRFRGPEIVYGEALYGAPVEPEGAQNERA